MRSNILKIDNAFKDFVSRHALINTYKGADYNGVSDNITYPMLWCAWTQRRSEVKQGSFNISVPIFIMAMPDTDGGAMTAAEVEQYAYDFIVEFEDSEDVNKFWFDINSTLVPVANVVGKGSDGSEGVRFEIIIHFRAGRNQPVIPID